jgi:hypothetical protein
LKREFTTPLVEIFINNLRDLDFDALSHKFEALQDNGVHISINSYSDAFDESNLKTQFKSTSSRSCCATIQFGESVLFGHVPGFPLRLSFGLKYDDGFQETVFGRVDYIFTGNDFVDNLQIWDDDQLSIIGILSVEIRFIFSSSCDSLISNRWLPHQTVLIPPQPLPSKSYEGDLPQIPIKNRFLELQHINDFDTISESELSHEMNAESEIFEDNSCIVRTISRTATISIQNIALQISLDQISSCLVLFGRFPQQNPPESSKWTESVCEEPLTSPSILLHSGKVVRRCGDCMSSIISSKILKR